MTVCRRFGARQALVTAGQWKIKQAAVKFASALAHIGNELIAIRDSAMGYALRESTLAKLARSRLIRAGGIVVNVIGTYLEYEHLKREGLSPGKAAAVAGGGLAGAIGFAKLGALMCAPGGPWLAAACALGGGLGGAVLGEEAVKGIVSEDNPLTFENQAKGWTSLIFPMFGD